VSDKILTPTFVVPNVSFVPKLAAIRAFPAVLAQARRKAIIKATAAFGVWMAFCAGAHACPCDAMSLVEGFEFFFETGHEYLFFAIVAKSSRYAYYQPEVCNWTSALHSKQVLDPDGRSEWLEDFIQRRYGPGESPKGKDPWEHLQSNSLILARATACRIANGYEKGRATKPSPPPRSWFPFTHLAPFMGPPHREPQATRCTTDAQDRAG